MRLEGELGFIRIENGAVTRLDLIGGTLLQKGTESVIGSGFESGTIEDVMRRAEGDGYNGLVTSASVPSDAAGRYVVVERPDGKTNGYKIEAVRVIEGNTVLDIGDYDPGFAPTGSPDEFAMRFNPFLRWNGEPIYRIADYASW